MLKNDIRNEIIKSINIIVGEKLKRLSFNYYIEGKIVTVSDNLCNVNINGNNYDLPFRKGIDLKIGDIVLILVPNGVYANKFIDMVRPY